MESPLPQLSVFRGQILSGHHILPANTPPRINSLISLCLRLTSMTSNNNYIIQTTLSFLSSTLNQASSSGLPLLYSHLQHHNDTITKTDARMKEDARRIMTQGGRRRKTTLTNIFYLSLYCKGSKGFERVACERELETEHKL